MQRLMLRAKITGARVTRTELHYEGSITIDRKIMKAADLLPGERVEVLNLNNGARLETYVIEGKGNSGVICLNGPAARQAEVGDEVIILSYSSVTEKEAKSIKPRLVHLGKNNKISRPKP